MAERWTENEDLLRKSIPTRNPQQEYDRETLMWLLIGIGVGFSFTFFLLAFLVRFLG